LRVQEMLLHLYYIYEKSSKKSKELENIVHDLREVYEFKKHGDLPIHSHGTRWITHKRRALLRVVERYGVYIAHLVTLTEDHLIKAVDRARLKGFLLKWKKGEMLLACCLYSDVIKPLSLLSLALQSHDANIVTSIESTLKSLNALKSLSKQDIHDWPTVKLAKSRVTGGHGQEEYQGVMLKDFNQCLEQCKTPVMAGLGRR
jgi:hypothetical protein